MSAHADRIFAAVEAGGATSANAASWRRCVKLYGIDPDRKTPPVRDVEAWREACERDADLIAIARPYLAELFRLFQSSDTGVFIADRHAMLLELRTDWARDSWGRPAEECLGTVYTEQLLGTNSVGTCIAEQRGLILRGGQHFLAQYKNVVCTSAPIFGPDGDIAGCLITTQRLPAHEARLDPFISVTIATLARRIEMELFAKAFPKSRLMMASAVGRHPCALLAVDSDDCVLGATRTARRLLNLPDASFAGSTTAGDLLEKPPRCRELADLERRAIEQALNRSEGNLSATARTMGISRSTLYRKMQVYEVARGRGSRNAPH